MSYGEREGESKIILCGRWREKTECYAEREKMIWCERENTYRETNRERYRERERHTHTDRQRDRDRKRDGQRERERKHRNSQVKYQIMVSFL